jgi:isopentenyldiphosphate isomerase
MEYLDIVDENDNVIKNAPRNEVYEKKLIHRIVHVLVFDKSGRMAIQLRTPNKSFCPDTWSTAVGGHVKAGETYEEGALREYQEELGVTSDIELAFKDFYNDGRGLRKFVATFKTTFEGPFHPNPDDIQRFDFFTMDEIGELIKKGDKFHPELLFLLKKYYNVG